MVAGLVHAVGRQPRRRLAATSAEALLALRALEGVGFLLASLPAPGLIRRLVEPARLTGMLGLWGAYMPFGTAVALLSGPPSDRGAGWPGWWWLLARALVRDGGLAVAWRCRPDADVRAGRRRHRTAWRGRVGRTLRSPGPWLAALAFAMYSAQWLAVIGFLPTIYAQAGLRDRVRRRGHGAGGRRQHGRQHRVGPAAAAGRRPRRCCNAASPPWALGGLLAFAPLGQPEPRLARRALRRACCCFRGRRPDPGHAVLAGRAGGARRARRSPPPSAGCSSGLRSASSPARRWWPGRPRGRAAGTWTWLVTGAFALRGARAGRVARGCSCAAAAPRLQRRGRRRRIARAPEPRRHHVSFLNQLKSQAKSACRASKACSRGVAARMEAADSTHGRRRSVAACADTGGVKLARDARAAHRQRRYRDRGHVPRQAPVAVDDLEERVR